MFSTVLAKLVFFATYMPQIKSTIVSTKYGDVEGVVSFYPNASGPFKSVSKFLGVPFAAPPTGNLKFKPPQPPQQWKPNVRQAKQYGNICWQDNSHEVFIRLFTQDFIYSEDCLFLDIYSPNVNLSLPVMMYIHGGGYESGTALIFQSDMLALHGVVVVVIQYRLGPFGFLTTGDSAASGNYGMLDQVAALKWVKENIENFGGDPSKVTIFGKSAGGTSVSLHLLSPLSRNLFHQAIAESGVDLSPFATQPTSIGVHFAKELAQKLDCTTSDHTLMVDCIRGKEGSEIQKAAELMNNTHHQYVLWAPIADKNFLDDSPQHMRRRGEFKKVPLMISFTSNEGSTFLEPVAKSSFGLRESVDYGVSPSYVKKFVTELADAQSSRNETAVLIADALEFMYTPWPDNSDKYAMRSQLIDLIGDYIFFAPSHEVADIHSKYAPVYMYEFAHRSKTASATPEWMGVAHDENVPFDFGAPLTLPFYDDVDKYISLTIMALYTNFAKYGDPTPLPVSGVTWEKYNSNHRAYLRVDSKSKMAFSFAPRRMAFWNNYHPKLTQVTFGTTTTSAGAKDTGEIFINVLLALALTIFN